MFYTDNNQQQKPDWHFYSICGCNLTQVRDTQYLGITKSNDFSWERHITTTNTEANRIIGFPLSPYPRQLQELAYFYLISSWIKNVGVVWEPIQLQTTRFVMNNLKRTTSVTEILSNLNWETLESRRKKSPLKLTNKIIDGGVAFVRGVHHTK